jgi:hypothetical protein
VARTTFAELDCAPENTTAPPCCTGYVLHGQAIRVWQESRLGEYIAQAVDDMTNEANVRSLGTAH